MKPFPSVAFLEFRDIPSGVFTTDAMLKKSPVAFLQNGTITRGRYLTLVGGSTASVEEAYAEGRATGGAEVLDHLFLADVHPAVFEAIFGRTRPAAGGAWAVVETDSVAASVHAAEAALKETPVRLLALRLADEGLAGKGVAFFEGELPDIEAALDAVERRMRASGAVCRHRVLSAPHEALGIRGAHGRFHETEALILEGEVV